MEYVAETIGTFVFVSVILITGQPIAIAAALLAVIYFTSNASKSSVNPAVSFALWCRGDLSPTQTAGYIVAEVGGALLAYLWYYYNKK